MYYFAAFALESPVANGVIDSLGTTDTVRKRGWFAMFRNIATWDSRANCAPTTTAMLFSAAKILSNSPVSDTSKLPVNDGNN